MLLTILSGMALARIASAQTIAVVRPAASDPVLAESFSRLCGELRMYGLQVRLLEGMDQSSSPDAQPGELGDLADVLGGVSLLRTAGQVSAKIWIAAKATGRQSVRITVSVDDADAPSLLAIRAADLLRASLRDLDGAGDARLAPQPADDAVGATHGSAALPVTIAPPKPWAVQVGTCVLWKAEALGAGIAPSAQVERRIHPRLALVLTIVAPVVGQTYASQVVTARLYQELATVAVALRLVGTASLAVDVFQGLGAMHLSLRGEAQSPWVAQSSSAWAAASSTGACLGIRLSEHLGLRLSMAALFLLPRPVLDVADAYYTIHQPLVLATGGFYVGF